MSDRSKSLAARAREADAWELCTKRGLSQTAIAEKLGVSQQAVSKMLARTEARVLATLKGQVETIKVHQTETLRYLVSEQLAAWEASKQPTKKSRRKTKAGGKGESSVEDVNEAEQRNGDARYVETARGLMADIRKIWGADAPLQTQDVPADPMAALSDADLEALIAEQLAAREADRARQVQATIPDSGVSSTPTQEPS